MFYRLAILTLLFAIGTPVIADDIHNQRQVTVSAVLDGDTIVLGHKSVHARLIGINCPEIDHQSQTAEPFALEARDYLKGLVLGRKVTLIPGHQPRDRYQRELVHILLADDTNPQSLLLTAGYCSVIAMPPNLRFLAVYQRAEQSARKAKLGVWGDSYFYPRSANQLQTEDQGYRFVQGRVQRIGRSRKYIYLDLDKRFSISIKRDNWAEYWRIKPADYLGENLIVRGWVIRSKRGYRTLIGHSAMLQTGPPGTQSIYSLQHVK